MGRSYIILMDGRYSYTQWSFLLAPNFEAKNGGKIQICAFRTLRNVFLTASSEAIAVPGVAVLVVLAILSISPYNDNIIKKRSLQNYEITTTLCHNDFYIEFWQNLFCLSYGFAKHVSRSKTANLFAVCLYNAVTYS